MGSDHCCVEVGGRRAGTFNINVIALTTKDHRKVKILEPGIKIFKYLLAALEKDRLVRADAEEFYAVIDQ